MISRALLAGVLCVPLLLAGCAAPETTPTFEVERRPFRHRVTAEGVLRAATATPVSVPRDVQGMVRLAWLAPDGSVVAAGEVVARFDGREMQQRLEDGQADLESAGLAVDKANVESTDKVRGLGTDLQVADLELDLAQRFRKTDDSVFSRNEILESSLDGELAEARKEHATVSRETQRDLGKTQAELLAIGQRRARLTIDRAEAGLEALEVRSPHDGLLTLKRNWRGEVPEVGSELWSGQEIAEIPDLATLEAEVFVLEADAGALAEEKPATVVVEAAPERAWAAKVRHVDAVAKPRRRQSPVQYFGVALEIEDADPALLKPGQRVRATLLLAEIEDALVVPRQAVVHADGEARVYVREGDGFTPRTVTIGASSMGLMVVTEGLTEGERIALRPPGDGGGDNGEDDASAAPPAALGGG